MEVTYFTGLDTIDYSVCSVVIGAEKISSFKDFYFVIIESCNE